MTALLYAGRYSDQLVDDFGEPIEDPTTLDYPTGPAEADSLITLGMECRGHWADDTEELTTTP